MDSLVIEELEDQYNPLTHLFILLFERWSIRGVTCWHTLNYYLDTIYPEPRMKHSQMWKIEFIVERISNGLNEMEAHNFSIREISTKKVEKQV